MLKRWQRRAQTSRAGRRSVEGCNDDGPGAGKPGPVVTYALPRDAIHNNCLTREPCNVSRRKFDKAVSVDKRAMMGTLRSQFWGSGA
jgi:hypothetical protein